MEIEYVVEDRPLGTAGSVRNAAHLLDDTFLVISGDALTDIDLTWALAEHRRRGSHASIVLKSVPNPLEYGVVVTEADGRVNRFLEKPSWGEVFSDHANTGIYVIEPSVLEAIKPDVSVDWSQDVFPQMLRRKEPLYGLVARGVLVRHRVDPVVHAGQLGCARGPRPLPHPGAPRGQRLDRRRRRVRHRRPARGTGVHRRRGEAQGRRVHQRPCRHRQVRDHRRQRQGLQHGDLAALLHRRELPAAPEHRVPQRHHQERQPARGEHRHR